MNLNHILKSYVRSEASRLAIGQSTYTTCPQCNSRKKSFGITKFQDCIKYQCFRSSCSAKGIIETRMSQDTIRQLLGRRHEVEIQKEFQMESHWLRGFEGEESLKFALKYKLLEPFRSGLIDTYTDLKLMRQVFLYTDLEGKVIGAYGRALIPGIKKAHIYLNSIRTPYRVGLDTKVGIVVEDHLSACRIGLNGFTGISLSGTYLQANWLSYFKLYKKLIVSLDRDASIKALSICNRLKIISDAIEVRLLAEDIKDMSEDKLKIFLRGT